MKRFSHGELIEPRSKAVLWIQIKKKCRSGSLTEREKPLKKNPEKNRRIENDANSYTLDFFSSLKIIF